MNVERIALVLDSLLIPGLMLGLVGLIIAALCAKGVDNWLHRFTPQE